MNGKHTVNFRDIGLKDIDKVGGKNASLGELINNLSSLGVEVPQGFATLANSFSIFLADNNIDSAIYTLLDKLDTNNVSDLAKTGSTIREMILNAAFSEEFIEEIQQKFIDLVQESGDDNLSVAVRSSATAEDLPQASFAGQQETFLNVKGVDAVLYSMKEVFASLFNDRAIAYRVHHKFLHNEVSLSVGVQPMIRSDIAVSGVMFSVDTESGFNDIVLINSSYGLGELIVQGGVNPDEFYVHKPLLAKNNPAVVRKVIGSKEQKMIYSENAEEKIKTVNVDKVLQNVFSLNDEEIQHLARQAVLIENHYGRPMDIEWAKDGKTGRLYILQARPETVTNRNKKQVLERYQLNETGIVLLEGRSVGQKIGKGIVKIINNISEMDRVEPGDILVTDMTDPDWEPIMKRASGIVTNRGGRTCHAAIIARELGIAAVVGCNNATSRLQDGLGVTVSCAQGDMGYIYEGLLDYECLRLDLDSMPDLPVKVMLNVGNPERAFAFQSVPNSGVGLARVEFLISNTIGIHPKALLEYDNLQDTQLKKLIDEKTAAYASPVEFYIERLKEGIATIAAAFHPKPVIVRLSDFKSNEYANLAGGYLYEPNEENPMLGFRGAARYVSKNFADCFALECEAIKRARDIMGLQNIELMIPFVRTLTEAEDVINTLKDHGLNRDTSNLRIIMMCELPSNALLADEFLEYFDGFSIGSNDLTQLTLGIDRDSSLVASQFNERNPAVKKLLHMAIKACKTKGKYIGICGQGPSDHQDFAQWLMQEGIDSLSLNPDSVLDTSLFLARQ